MMIGDKPNYLFSWTNGDGGGFPTQSSPGGDLSTEQLLFEIADDLAAGGVLFHAVFVEGAVVEDDAVIPPAKGFADGVEGAFGHLTREEHGDLPGKCDI